MRAHDAANLARITGVAIVTDSTPYLPAAAGSGLRFEDRGEHQHKGIAQSWRLLALTE
jgi:hypothetical protein